jgi:hypothetical protein
VSVAPLFISDRDALKSRVRLSASVNPDTEAAIDTAITKARVVFFDNLGAARVAEIVALVPSDSPTTDDEIIRAKAEIAEALHVRMTLKRELPQFFIDAGAQALQRFNEEGMSRRDPMANVEKEIEVMAVEFQGLLDALGGSSPDEESSIRVTTFEPDETPPRPYDSIRTWAEGGRCG